MYHGTDVADFFSSYRQPLPYIVGGKDRRLKKFQSCHNSHLRRVRSRVICIEVHNNGVSKRTKANSNQRVLKINMAKRDVAAVMDPVERL